MIQVQTVVNAPIEKVWSLWTEADHIKNWCSASVTGMFQVQKMIFESVVHLKQLWLQKMDLCNLISAENILQ